MRRGEEGRGGGRRVDKMEKKQDNTEPQDHSLQ